MQEGLGRLSEDSDEGVYSHHHSLPWETRPAPAYQGAAAVATSAAEEDEQPLELVKRKQDPEGRSRVTAPFFSLAHWENQLEHA